MSKVRFDVPEKEKRFVLEIAKRAKELLERQPGKKVDEVSVAMDIAATHMNGCPLRLEDVANADDFNFVHDVVGINNHIDRKTEMLDHRFLPRFALGDDVQL